MLHCRRCLRRNCLFAMVLQESLEEVAEFSVAFRQPLPVADPADRLGPTSVALPIVHSKCTLFATARQYPCPSLILQTALARLVCPFQLYIPAQCSVPAACLLWCMFCTFMRTSDVSRRIRNASADARDASANGRDASADAL